MTRRRTLPFALWLCLATPAGADTLHIAAAGSLSDAFNDLIRRFAAGPDEVARPEFGPSGLLRQRIATGLPADLFASADMAQARALADGHPERPVIEFTRNRLCALARPAVGLTPANMLERLLDPAVRVAMSTPGSDPGGDYAWQVFARADAMRPGARAALEAKALPLVGNGAKTPAAVPGRGEVEGVFLTDRADVMLGYCSGAIGLVRAIPGLQSVALPPELTVGQAYGMVVLDPKPVALRFPALVMSEAGQGVLAAHGFDPVALAEPGRPAPGLVVQRSGREGRVVAPEMLATVASATQLVAGEHVEAAWSGPLLWDVLAASGAIDPARHAEDVRLSVRVTGADGYFTVLGLGELSPEFAGKPIQLATAMDGKPLPGGLPRLIVPGEKRAGRSVRDVVRIDVQ